MGKYRLLKKHHFKWTCFPAKIYAETANNTNLDDTLRRIDHKPWIFLGGKFIQKIRFDTEN